MNPGRILIVSALAVLAIVPGASAFFVSSGTGTASAIAGALRQSTLTATPESPGAGEVTLHWTAVTAPGSGAEYYVTRVGGTVGGDCPSSAATATTSLSCTDRSLAAGTYGYTVTAIWRSWTSTSDQSNATLDYGPLTQLKLAVPSTATAGVGFGVNVTAQDANGNTVADYAGNHDLIFSGASLGPNGIYPTVTDTNGTAQTFGTAETIAFSDGVASDGATSDVMTLYKAETANISVTDGTVDSNTVPVTVGTASVNNLVFTSSAVSGAASSSASVGPITVQEQDQFGNPTTSAETVSLSSSSPGSYLFSTTQGASTGSSSVSIPSGSSSVTFYYGDTHADGPTITAAATGLTSTTQTETINPAAAKKLVFTSSAVAGAASSSADLGPITVQEQDQFGNPTTTAETVSLSSSSPGTYIFNTTQGASTPTGDSTVNIPAGSSTATFYYGDTVADGPTITAAATGLTSATQTETINAAAVKKLVFTSSAVSGAASSSASVGPITVQEQDQFGNPTTNAETVSLSSNSPGTYIFNTTQGATTPTGNTTVNIPSGSSSVSFYYGDTVPDGPTINAAATGLTSATQTETITGTAPPAITGVSNDAGSVKISGTGTGTAGGSITVNICASATSCDTPVDTATATVGAGNVWTSSADTGGNGGNLNAGQQYWAEAIETNPTGKSTVFGPFKPEKVNSGSQNPTTTITAPLSTTCFFNVTSTCTGTSSSWTAEGGEITGTASPDGNGTALTSVQVAIQNPNGLWWNGSSFSAVAPVYNLATGTSSWSYPITAAQLGSTTGTFTLVVTATDIDDMTSTPATTGTFAWKN